MIKTLPIRGAVSKSGLRRATGTLLVLTVLSLSGCTSTQMAGPTPAAGSTLTLERVGEGKTKIGLLSTLEPNNLSEGAEDSVHLAAKLAITSLKQGLATLEIRPAGSSDQTARQGATALALAGARIVISGGDQAVGSAVAKELGAKGIPTISLAAVGDTGAQLYGAGLGTRSEIATLIAEFERRNYSHIAVALTVDATSQAYATAVSNAASGANIVASSVDASNATALLAALTQLTQTTKLDAIVFAIGPARATELVSVLRATPAHAGITIVGNANWATAEPLGKALSGAWYPSLPRDGLARFVGRFRAAYGSNPTLTGALVYDLIIMAAALPEAVSESPYGPEVLRSDSGFGGFSGPFRFGAANLAEMRDYTIITAR